MLNGNYMMIVIIKIKTKKTLAISKHRHAHTVDCFYRIDKMKNLNIFVWTCLYKIEMLCVFVERINKKL